MDSKSSKTAEAEEIRKHVVTDPYTLMCYELLDFEPTAESIKKRVYFDFSDKTKTVATTSNVHMKQEDFRISNDV
jgi:hypothetical protein